MNRYRIRVSVRADGNEYFTPQRKILGIFWVDLKESSSQDDWPIIRPTEEQARDDIFLHKAITSNMKEVAHEYKGF